MSAPAPSDAVAGSPSGASPITAAPVLTLPRAAAIASTAAVGNAVRRNRAKRRLREVFRCHQQLVPGDVDLLMIAKRSLNTLPHAEVERKFVEACAKIFPPQK